MTLLEIIILAAAFLSIISLSTIFIQRHKKAEPHDGYKYWFNNVDEIL